MRLSLTHTPSFLAFTLAPFSCILFIDAPSLVVCFLPLGKKRFNGSLLFMPCSSPFASPFQPFFPLLFPCFFWLILILPYTNPRLSSLSFSPVFILKCEPSCSVGLFFECFLPAVPIQNTLRGTLLRSESLSRKQRRRRKLNLDSHRKKKRQKPEKKAV
ncbi:hypothetical protein K457DRAFT_262164 [Linnemannia elongata AG-77]|uniref:Uncharacterized protein n=1 Tax=Linnemannia elongata AG-77 TaxID=1314771 RepID=A0A197JDC1_9FUNG|nr:hypothetical protein K457DRAFT_262164 [Linnemannia elongata AG-77]